VAKKRFDWLDKLDLDQALRNCHLDIFGDWYRDPWGWPELDWCASHPDFVVQRLNSEGVLRSAKLDVAKENFSTRPALIIDPTDRLVYQALVDSLSVSLIGGLASWIYGVRLEIKNPRQGIYGRMDRQWGYYRNHLKALALQRAALKTDVVSFFGSIPIDGVVDQIVARAGETPITRRLEDMLAEWGKIPGRSGLPQRYVPSSVLATMYLGPVDDQLAHYGTRKRKSNLWLPFRAVRWMDDIWLFGRDVDRLRHAQIDIELVMRELGLNMALAKTDVLEGDQVAIEVQQREHSAVDAGLQGPEPSRDALDDLINQILERPERANRTSVRFATERMRRYRMFDRIEEFAGCAERMPHVADALARLFRDAGVWSDLSDWYVGYATSNWGVIDWSVAQFGTMFPSGQRGPSQVQEYLSGETTSSSSLTVLALGAQRLAAWDKGEARVVIREAAKRNDHPLARRVLALAALSAGDDRTFIRGLLSEFEENRATLTMLKDRNFKKLKVRGDFEGS
jgi:hypothetical protein